MDTYVVRVWRPGAVGESASTLGLHGTIQHVGSGAEAPFVSAEQLTCLLHTWSPMPLPERTGGPAE